LASNGVTAIYEDDKGHLWFGTFDKGVSEFDGSTFRNYTIKDGLASSRVGAIAQDKEGVFWFGHEQKNTGFGGGVTRYDGNVFTHLKTTDGLVNNGVTSILTDTAGNVWFGTNGGLSRYDGKTFENFTTAAGFPITTVYAMLQTENGDLWFTIVGRGVSRYRDGRFQNFTTADGLTHSYVFCIAEDREGNLWFGTITSGVSRYDSNLRQIPTDVSERVLRDTKGNLWWGAEGVGAMRYDGKSLQVFSIEDGLPSRMLRSIGEDSRGNIWIGTQGRGLARYDGENFQTFTTKDGLLNNFVRSIYEDRKGVLWIGTDSGGLCTYDGEKFIRVAGVKELGDRWSEILSILEDRTGNMWLSSFGGGVARYDGRQFTKFNTDNGLPNNTSLQLLEDRNGNIWIPTRGGGIARYDGRAFQTFTVEDGLAENRVELVFEDSKGNLWFGVATGGVHKFDGKNFQQFTTTDGLLHNSAWGIEEDSEGNLIFATSHGLTIYTPPKEQIPPPVAVTKVVADKIYEKPSEGLRIPSTTPRITITYYGMSFKTKRMRYNYRLEGYDTEWQKTWEEEASYENLKPGEYTFKVIAITRDLVYSDTPASVKIEVIADPRDAQIVQLETDLEKRNRELERLNAGLEAELADAHDVQMSLIPESAPRVAGLDIAGKCVPATEVSGDFFDYLQSQSGDEISIVVGDVTGHGMRGAMNAMMTNGILHSVVEANQELAPAELMAGLNNTLTGRLEEQMNVTMVIGHINAFTRHLTLANAGHHAHPLLIRDGTIEPLVYQEPLKSLRP
jgi:ligand-binding sensor domain-containing protein